MKKFKQFLKNNKEKLEKEFNYYYQMELSDVVDNHASDEDLADIDNGDQSYDDWYELNNESCSYTVEYNAAFKLISIYKKEMGVENNETSQGYLIEFLGFSISHSKEKLFYKED